MNLKLIEGKFPHAVVGALVVGMFLNGGWPDAVVLVAAMSFHVACKYFAEPREDAAAKKLVQDVETMRGEVKKLNLKLGFSR